MRYIATEMSYDAEILIGSMQLYHVEEEHATNTCIIGKPDICLLHNSMV